MSRERKRITESILKLWSLSKFWRNSLLIGILLGMLIVLAAATTATIIAFRGLPDWKRQWLRETARRFLYERTAGLNHPQIVFASPPNWNFTNSALPPHEYHQARHITGNSTSNMSVIYNEQIGAVAGSKDAAIQRDEFLKEWLSKVNSLPEPDRTTRIRFLVQNQIGYLPDRAPQCTLLSSNKMEIWFSGRYGAKFRSLRVSINKPKGIVMALHGRDSSPEGVLGRTSDYSNSFGDYWHKSGYDVFAPDIQPEESVGYPRLGLSSAGADIARLLDLIEYIEKENSNNLPIIVVGISYGSKLAETLGLLSSDIDAVVSIGGASRYDYVFSMYSLPSNAPFHGHYLNSILNGGGVYELLLPKRIVISVGNYDAGNWGRNGENKIYVLNSFVNRNKHMRDYFRINLFRGVHEADPKSEIGMLEEILE